MNYWIVKRFGGVRVSSIWWHWYCCICKKSHNPQKRKYHFDETFHRWLHWKLPFWPILVYSVTTISWKWHLRFYVLAVYTDWDYHSIVVSDTEYIMLLQIGMYHYIFFVNCHPFAICLCRLDICQQVSYEKQTRLPITTFDTCAR